MSLNRILTELKDFKNHFLLWFISLIILVIVISTVKLPVNFLLNSRYIENSQGIQEKKTLISQIFIIIKKDLLPEDVELISISPIVAFWVEIKISMLISFLILAPYLFFSIVSYLSPALFPKEKRKLFIFTIMASILFFGGIVFSYIFLVKTMFTALFSFNSDLSVKPFLPVDEFVSWTLATLFITGFLFMLPISMYVLTVLRIVSVRFWVFRWREVFIIFLIAASIITPDVSGVSVLILTIPMILLYTFGIIISARAVKKVKKQH